MDEKRLKKGWKKKKLAQYREVDSVVCLPLPQAREDFIFITWFKEDYISRLPISRTCF